MLHWHGLHSLSNLHWRAKQVLNLEDFVLPLVIAAFVNEELPGVSCLNVVSFALDADATISDAESYKLLVSHMPFKSFSERCLRVKIDALQNCELFVDA